MLIEELLGRDYQNYKITDKTEKYLNPVDLPINIGQLDNHKHEREHP